MSVFPRVHVLWPGLLLLVPSLVWGEVTFRATDVFVESGGTGNLSVRVDSTELIAGFAYGLCPSDYQAASVLSVQLGAALVPFGSGSGPDFFQAEIAPAPEMIGGSHSVGCIFDFDGVEVLGPSADQELVVFEIAALGSESVEFCFCDILGAPDVVTVYVTPGGGSLVPTTVCGSVTVASDVTAFRRGDCNDDGAYDLGDAIAVLDLLFAGGSVPCDSACDANDDGSVDLGDGIFVLSSLFSGGAVPSAPGLTCGEDPTADALSCDDFSACP